MSDDGSADVTLVEQMMEVVAPIIGGITVGLILTKWTSMPVWVCLLIALPVGTVLGWLTMLAAVTIIGLIINSVRTQRRNRKSAP